MKSVFLSVVIICALAIAGVGGTLAGFSDSEISQDNVITTGSLDLKVNGEDDLPWGAGVPVKVVIDDMWPSKYHHIDIEVRNDGQAPDDVEDPDLYVHFKNYRCSNVTPDHGGIVAGTGREGFPVSPADPGVKPEPELVAEYGGLVDQRWVEGIGRIGDNCSLNSHIDVQIFYGPADGTMVEVYPPTKMYLIESLQIPLGKLPPCGETWIITLVLHLQQIEDFGEWPAKHDPDDLDTVPEKFKYWPTNALMKDKIMFDIEFDLIGVDP